MVWKAQRTVGVLDFIGTFQERYQNIPKQPVITLAIMLCNSGEHLIWIDYSVARILALYNILRFTLNIL